MTTVRYTTIKGEVIAEKRNGTRRLYVPDPLGSTVALLDNTQTQVDTFNYWPYGEVRTSTGTTLPPYQYVGTKGYYTDGVGRTYVRARYLHTQKGRWLTQDPTQDGVNWYEYAGANPILHTDPTGLQPPGTGAGQCPGAGALAFLQSLFRNNPTCATAFNRVCPSGLGATLGAVTIIVSKNCAPKLPGSESACITFPGQGPGQGCNPEYICFNTATCSAPTQLLACLLLWELVNWCGCKHRGQKNEKAAQAVIDSCGLQAICTGAGVSP